MSDPLSNTLALLEIIRIDGAYNMPTQFFGAVQHAKLLAEEHGIEIDDIVKRATKVGPEIRALYRLYWGHQTDSNFERKIAITNIILGWKWWRESIKEKESVKKEEKESAPIDEKAEKE